MGINGLLPFLEKCTRKCHVSEFRGGTVAVDTYCWLHKGATACAEQLAKGQHTDMYIKFCLKYVKMLLSYDIRPIMVFDGRHLPAKSETEKKRREKRKTAKKHAAELLALGKVDEARNYFRQSIDITPEMALNLIKECRKLNVDCIVAPYESDAQLAFFSLKGIAEVIITEDSDLVLFGCNKVLYKMDLTGCGQLVEADKINLAMNMRPDHYSFDKFRYMCILSGCDYLESLPGIGLKKALKFLSLTAENDPELFLDKLPRYLNMRHLNVTPEFKENFMVALATFQHQTVFDPFKKALVPLIEPGLRGTKPEHCRNSGDLFDNEQAYQIAIGNLEPMTLKKLDDWSPPPTQGFASNSIWSNVFKKRSSRVEVKQTVSAASNKENKAIKVEKDDENIMEEYDLKISSQLKMYTVNKLETLELVDEPIEKKVEAPTSPTLTKNPFLIKKKLSKFQRTVVPGNDSTVKSRFFSKSEDNILTEKPIEDVVEQAPNIKKREIDDQCEVKLEEKSETHPLVPVESPQKQADLKRRKIGPCRKLGLPVPSKSQPTLMAMFDKMKQQK